MPTIEMLSQRFTNFAENECKGSSELYEFLASEIAKDEELLEICNNARSGQPVPNLIFGAVQFLLLKGKEHRVKEFYPSLVINPLDHKESFESFKDFCLLNKDEIIHIIQTKLVQTNEVRRCGYLYPVFSYVYAKTKKPLALIEIGTSAGLQLLWDQYSYTYNTNEVFGNIDSTLNITSESKNDRTPFLRGTSPPVTTRVGIDLNPVDLNDEEEKLWLKSLIWPEHIERQTMFENAAENMKGNPIQLVKGDGIALLKQFVENVPFDNTVCIYHTHVASRCLVASTIAGKCTSGWIGINRDVFHIYNNIQDKYLHLDHYLNGVEVKQTIAETDGHGRWFKWLLENSPFTHVVAMLIRNAWIESYPSVFAFSNVN